MNRHIVVTPEAEDDLLDAFGYYESRHPGLGDRFLDYVEDVFRQLSENPELYQEIERDIRRAVVLKFPYCVFYGIEGDVIVILAVIHAAQDPDYIEARLRI